MRKQESFWKDTVIMTKRIFLGIFKIIITIIELFLTFIYGGLLAVKDRLFPTGKFKERDEHKRRFAEYIENIPVNHEEPVYNWANRAYTHIFGTDHLTDYPELKEKRKTK